MLGGLVIGDPLGCAQPGDHVVAGISPLGADTPLAVGEQFVEPDRGARPAPLLGAVPLGDLRAEITMLARWNLASLDRRAGLTHFVRREADLLPQRLRTKLYDRLVARPYGEIVDWLTARFRQAGIDPPDLDALALILIESMAAYRELNRLFGEVPGEVDDGRFVEAWVEAVLAIAHRYGLS